MNGFCATVFFVVQGRQAPSRLHEITDLEGKTAIRSVKDGDALQTWRRKQPLGL